MRHFLLALGAAVTLGVSSAGAQTVLLDDPFSGSATVLNHNQFTNWDVLNGTTVDLIRSGDYGITCAGGVGYCVDMSGSTGSTSNGTLQSKLAYSFSAGDLMRFQVQVAGNQRGGGSDPFTAFINFVSPTAISGVRFAFGSDVVDGEDATFAAGESLFMSGPVASTDPFTIWSISFTAATAGSAFFGLSTSTTDNVGPVIDNALVSRTASAAVPEPRSLGLLGAGLLALGFRRRRVRAASAS